MHRVRSYGSGFDAPRSGESHTWGFFFSEAVANGDVAERAVLFVDGNNWYHGLKSVGVQSPAALDYCKIAGKLVGAAREWIELRYYIGRMTTKEPWMRQAYSDQRRFLAALEASDKRISVHFGRMEPRDKPNDAASELLRYLGGLATKIDPTVREELFAIGRRHRTTSFLVEKAVDVALAVDLVTMAQADAYDTAYILSADGDYTHAVQYVRRIGTDPAKKVFAASCTSGAQLASVVNSFIRIRLDWFTGCYVDGYTPPVG